MSDEQLKDLLKVTINGKLSVKSASDIEGTFNYSKAYEFLNILKISLAG